jgi:hypothetical protein
MRAVAAAIKGAAGKTCDATGLLRLRCYNANKIMRLRMDSDRTAGIAADKTANPHSPILQSRPFKTQP